MIIDAAVARPGQHHLAIERLLLAEPRADEIRVRLVATGICHTDLKALEEGSPVPRPVVLGHEGTGVVDAVGARVTKVRPGDHVVLTVNSCGTCRSCLAHAPAYCHDLGPRNFGGLRPDGTSPISHGSTPIHGNFFGQSSFATFAITTERNTVRVPKDIALDILAPLGCGVQTGAGAILNTLRPQPGQSLVIFGAGAVGLSAVMAARLTAAGPIVAVDLVPSRLALAREFGATHTLDPAADDIPARIAEITAGGADLTLDTTGAAAAIRQAVACLAPRGVCGVLASPPREPDITFSMPFMIMGGRRLQGIIQGSSEPDLFIPQMIELYRQGRLPFDRLVTFYAFDQIAQACDDARAGTTIKPVLRVGGPAPS